MKKGRKTNPSVQRVLTTDKPRIRAENRTPTPRTDAMLAENGIRCECSDKPVSLCRQLEQELAVAVDEYLKAADEIGEWKQASGLKVCGDLEKVEPRHLQEFLQTPHPPYSPRPLCGRGPRRKNRTPRR